MEHALDGSLLYAAHLILSFLTLWLLFVFGWGEYFPVTWNPPARKEVVAIDRITDVLFMNSGYRGIWWKTVAMSLRWSLLGIPYWATQAVFSGEYGRAAIAAGSLLLAGPAYWTMNLVKGDTAPADLIMGLLLGAASITIWYPIGI